VHQRLSAVLCAVESRRTCVLASALDTFVGEYGQRDVSKKWKLRKCDEMLELIQVAFPDKPCKLNVFGSTLNGFGFDISDLDLCLRFEENETELPDVSANVQ
jgi:hypothetical protein